MEAHEFTASVEKLRVLLTTNLPTINEEMALDATAMIKDRVVNEGTNAQGSSFGKYSTNEIPLFFKKNGKLMAPFSNPLNDSGEAFFLSVAKQNVKRRKKGEAPRGISYEQWRQANNRPTDHVTLSFTGTTMKDIGVVRQIVSDTKIITNVGPKNTKTRKNNVSTETVVEGLGDRFGNFLEPNPEEVEKLKTYLQKQVEKLIHESFK